MGERIQEMRANYTVLLPAPPDTALASGVMSSSAAMTPATTAGAAK